MITIEGLTQRQRNIMDLLWSCNTEADVQTLIQALPTPADQYDAQSLVKIATWDSLELELGLTAYEDLAHRAISHAGR
jgi:hypothetical protein